MFQEYPSASFRFLRLNVHTKTLESLNLQHFKGPQLGKHRTECNRESNIRSTLTNVAKSEVQPSATN